MNAPRVVLATVAVFAALVVISADSASAATTPWTAHRSVEGMRARDSRGDDSGQYSATPDSVRGSDNVRPQEARPASRADESVRTPRATDRPATTERPTVTRRETPEPSAIRRESEAGRETHVSRPETTNSAASERSSVVKSYPSGDTPARTETAPKGDLRIDSGRVVREGSTSTSRGSSIFSHRGASQGIQREQVTTRTDARDRSTVSESPRRLPGEPASITERSSKTFEASRSDRLESMRHSAVASRPAPVPSHRPIGERTVASRADYHPERHVAKTSFSFQGTIVTNNFAVGVGYGHVRPACVPVWHPPVVYRPCYCPIIYHPVYYHPIICQPVIVRPWWTCCTPTWYWPYNGWSVGYHGHKWSIFISDIWPTRTYVETVYVAPPVETVVVEPAPVRVIEPYDSVDRLIDRLKYGDVDARKDAAQELGRMNTYKAMYPLIYAAEYDSEPLVRHYAVKSLGKLGYRDALPALRKIADQDQEEVVRAEAQDSIDRILDRQT